MLVNYQDIEPGQLNSLWALLMGEEALQRWFLTANPQLRIKDFRLVGMSKVETIYETTLRFTFIVGVISPVSTVNSSGNKQNFLMVWY